MLDALRRRPGRRPTRSPIADIWAGRDPDTTIASAAGLAEADGRAPARDPGRRARARSRRRQTWLAGQVRAGDAVLVMGGGRSYRIGELLLAAARRTRPMIDYAGGRRPARALRRGPGRRSTATPGSRSSPRTPSTMRTRSSRRSSATTPCGHTCWRRPSIRNESRVHGRAPLGRRRPRSSPPGMPSYVRRRRPRARPARRVHDRSRSPRTAGSPGSASGPARRRPAAG